MAEHGLYWAGFKTEGEARFLCALLNSETLRQLAEQWQSTGQWGRRHFDKAVFNLPIPLYDQREPVHQALAVAARKAERVAAFVEVRDGEHFTRTRRRIRAALIEDGVAGRIEALVAELIGVPPAATLPAKDETSDAD